ncbi:MAG: metallophosphoesterase [Vicinamibacterales bacterium]
MTPRRPLARTAAWTALALTLLLAPAAAGPPPARVVAVGDVHGAYEEFTAILQTVGLIDGRRRWTGGTATLVQTGDVVDRGPKQRECLDLLMELQRQAPRAGGKVVTLVGNHEVMNVIGDLRYVTPSIFATFADADSKQKREKAYKDYLRFLAAHEGHGHETVPPPDEAARQKWLHEHPPGFFEHREAFGPDGKYGKWIRSNRAVVQVGDGIFVHGGVNPALKFESVRELDQQVVADLPAFDDMWKELVDARVIWRDMTFAEAVRFAAEELAWRQSEGPVGVFPARLAVLRLLGYKNWITLSADGPLWYRGLGTEPEAKLGASLTAMLERLKATYIVAGHSVVASKEVTARFGSRVFLIDTGMLGEVYAGRGSALEIRDGRFTAHRVDTMPRTLPSPASAKVPVLVR